MHAFKNSNVTSSNGNGNPADGIEKYSKNMLNSYYLQDRVMVKQQCLFGTLFTTKVPGRHFLVSESWRKGVKMTEPNRQSGENEERIIEIEMERLRPFKEHPFQVKDDKEMFLLQESIEKYGILNPLIVRPVPDA